MPQPELTRDTAKHVFESLDMRHVRQCAALVRSHWSSNVPAFELSYMPGDMTHYGLLFTILTPSLQVLGVTDGSGGAGEFRPYTITGCAFDGTFASVTWIQHGRSLIFGNRDVIQPDWLQQKFDVGPASGLALTVLFNTITEYWDDESAENLLAVLAAREDRL